MIDTVIDLYHKDHIDLAQVQEQDGIIAIIRKATQDRHFRDPSYTSRKKTAKDIGLLWGAYHFGTADQVDAPVDDFLSTADVDEDVLIALDFEEDPHDPGMTIEQGRDFVELTREKTGFPVIYEANLLRESLGSVVDPLLKKCPLAGAGEAPDQLFVGAPSGLAEMSEMGSRSASDPFYGRDLGAVRMDKLKPTNVTNK